MWNEKLLFTDLVNTTAIRLDLQLLKENPDLSRNQVAKLIKSGKVLVDFLVEKEPSRKLYGGEKLQFQHSEAENCCKEDELKPQLASKPSTDLKIIFEDEDLLILDKPQGLVVHPCSSHLGVTLVHLLVAYLESQKDLPRAGLVHRLDKDTSGVIVAAKNFKSYYQLCAQFNLRSVNKVYTSLNFGVAAFQHKVVQAAIARHKTDRKKMAAGSGRLAHSEFTVIAQYRLAFLAQAQLKTGRTHQLRVHSHFLNHPILGDKVYFTTSSKKLSSLYGINRQMLHASSIGFIHPRTLKTVSFQAHLPEDMQLVLNSFNA